MKKLLFVNTMRWILVAALITLTAEGYAATQRDLAKTCDQLVQRLEKQSMPVPGSLANIQKSLKAFSGSSKNANSRVRISKITVTELNVVVEALQQNWDGSAWYDVAKQIQTYNDTYTELLSYVEQQWDGSQWVNFYRMLPTTNAQGQVTKLQFDNWTGLEWQSELVYLSSYNAQGNVAEDMFQVDSDYDGVLENSFKWVYTYTSNRLVQEDMYVWDADSSAWMKFYVTTYTYNAQGLVTEELTSMDLGPGMTFPVSKIVYTYNASGLPLTETESTFDMGLQTWSDDNKWTYSYDASGNSTVDLYQEWNGSSWDNVDRYTYTHNAQHYLTQELYETWDGSAWVNYWLDQYTYDAHGNNTVYLFQTWDGSQWVNEERWLFTYGGTDVAKRDHNLPVEFTLSNYPNPFNPVTHLEIALPSEDRLNVQILDIRGRIVKTLVRSESLQAGVHRFDWDGTDQEERPLPSGVYLYSVQGEKFLRTGRCMLLK